MGKYVVVLLLLTGALGGVWMHGNIHGKLSCEHSALLKRQALTEQLDTLKREARENEQALVLDIEEQREVADRAIQTLLNENAELSDWWNTHVPDGGLDYAFGVRE